MRHFESAGAGLLVGFALAVSLGCGGPTAPAIELRPSIPRPVSLDQAESAIQEQYRQQRLLFDQRLAAADEERSRAAAYGELGQWHLAHGFHLAATACFRAAADVQPEDARWPYFLATIDRKEGRWPAAIEGYERVLTITSPAPYLPALLWWASIELDHHRLDRADDLYRRALALKPTNAVALHGQAKVALARGQPGDAVPLLRQALELQPRASVLIYTLAQVELAQGRQAKAQALLATLPDDNRQHQRIRLSDPWIHGVELLAGGVFRHLQAGRQARREGNVNAALEHFREAIATDPDHLAARLALARLEIDLGRPRRARRQLDVATKLDPGDLRIRWLVVRAAILLGELKEAEAILQQTLATDPLPLEGRLLMASVWLGQERYSSALDALNELLLQHPDDPRVIHGKVRCLLAMDRPNEARRALTAGLQRLPNEPALVALAKHLERAG